MSEKFTLLGKEMQDLLNCYCGSNTKKLSEPFKSHGGIVAGIDKELKKIYGVFKRTSITVVCKKPFVYNSAFFELESEGTKYSVMKRFSEELLVVEMEERIIVK